MSHTQRSAFRGLPFLLFATGILVAAVGRPALAQQETNDEVTTSLYDDDGTTYLYGYAEIDASADATMLYAYAYTMLDYQGNGGPDDNTWYGAAVSATLKCNNVEVDEDSQIDAGESGEIEVYFTETTQPSDQWALSSQYGYYWVQYCDPNSGGEECDPTYPVNTNSSLTVGDPTPVISSVSPSTWYANGQGQSVVLYGTGFGTNPTVQVLDSSITLSSFSYSYGYIYFTATVPSNDINTSTQLTVKCNGYGDSGFSFGSPPNGANQTSLPYTITITP